MKAGIAAAVILAGSLVSGTALAGGGAKLLSGCKGVLSYWHTRQLTANDNQVDMGYCLGVVHGVRNTLELLDGWMKNDYAKVCLPAGYTEQMGVRTVVKFLEGHPDELEKEDVLVTMLALKAEYPCH